MTFDTKYTHAISLSLTTVQYIKTSQVLRGTLMLLLLLLLMMVAMAMRRKMRIVFFFFSFAGDFTGRPVVAMNEAVLRRPPMVPRTACSALLVPLTRSPPSAADGSGSPAGHDDSDLDYYCDGHDKIIRRVNVILPMISCDKNTGKLY